MTGEPTAQPAAPATAQATDEPDSTAVRVALWRALHVEVDAARP